MAVRILQTDSLEAVHILQIDSLEAVRILQTEFIGSHSFKWHLQELCSCSWTVQIKHTNRSGNNVADKLAKNANVDSLEPTLYAALPPWLLSLLLEDVSH
ncbi:hypothetical protein V6N12_070409 [Hibiscus sabdariffa]|uniref:RNase H type-1 domain-containing protein n=1 Tax=Hibiscus sabdariffa TaxID=183260 RepID=A0ABR2FGX3_9ROSI